MRSPQKKNNSESPQLATAQNPPSSAMEDAVRLLFTDDRVFAPLSAWIEKDLARLEARFATFRTSDSQQATSR